MTKLWAVWETEYPDRGVVAVEANSMESAKRAYEQDGFKDGTAALNAFPLTMANEPEPLPGVSAEQLADVLKAGYRSILREADEWRPLANHVLGLMRLAREEERRALPCPVCTEGPMVRWCACCGEGVAPPSEKTMKVLFDVGKALESLKHRDVDGHECWCFLWPDEKPHCEAKQEKDPNTQCAQAQAALLAAKPYLGPS